MSFPCLVCSGNTDAEVVQGRYCYWKCRSCRTAQLVPRPTPEELDEIYTTFHLPGKQGGHYVNIEDRMQADFPLKARIARSVASDEDAALLDVGCGKGFFLKQAVSLGFRAQGIDLSRSGIQYAVSHLGVQAMLGRIDETYPPEWNEAFEVVTLWATIEHLSSPLETLNAIYRCLRPGGTLLMDTGVGDAPFEKFLPGYSQWYDAPEHLWVFSVQGIRLLLERAGLEVHSIDMNFERTLLRRWLKWAWHFAVCMGSYTLYRVAFGAVGFRKMRKETKWAVGRLMSIQARKPFRI